MVVIGEVAVALSVVGWFMAPNITELMNVARESAATRSEPFRSSKEKLAKLAQDLEGIKCLLDQASTTIVSDQDRLDRLWRLKDDIHDTEEVLDWFQLKKLDIEASSNNLVKKKKHLSNKFWLSGQLEKLLSNIGEACDTAREIQHGAVTSILTRAETGPNPVRDETSFFGYQAEYAQLVSMLWQDAGHKVDNKMQQVIAIVGHGGMGKTEHARQAFRDAKGKFDLRIWVHAYNKNTEFDLLKEIWRSVAGDRPVGEMNVSSLQKQLEKILASKRCLLVLDDVWNHESAASEEDRKKAWLAVDLFTHFTEGGSRVVMTTRAKICSTTFKADASIILNGIKPEEVTLRLNDTANLRTDGTDQRIQELLNKQVPKLKGSPLAAVEIGDELKQQATSEKCCNILENIEQHLGSVLSCHLFTYRHLPPHLQRCFEFCSIFRSNWRFKPEKLTRMWIAHGFVDGTQQSRSMEDVARCYFNSLVEHSLFEEQGELGGKETTYVIHEQIHWMLRLASTKNCISISDRNSAAERRISTTVRHLSVTSCCLDQLKANPGSLQLKKLRTLLVLKNDDGRGGDTTIDKGIGTMLKLFKGVRVLDLTQTGLTQLPGTIGKLKHVRYLGLPGTVRSLCDQLSGLLFLQTFSISDDGRRKENTCRLQMFPKDMNRLINMRHLDIHTECTANISGIGKMVKLQGSIVFKAMRGTEKEGHSVSELAGMNSLGGTLTIKGLDVVASKEEAMAAQLANKGSVKVLKLEWGPPDPRQVNGGHSDVALAVLEGLQPHRDLHDLHITRYPGATSPSWLGVAMEKLVCLYLKNCRRLQTLPAVGGLPCLELLDIKELPCVERIDDSFCGSGAGPFPKLKKIVLDDMPSLVAWDGMLKQAPPQLREVSIVDCPSLSSLSGLKWCSSLHLSVKGCPAITQLTLPANFNGGNCNCKFY